MDIVSLQNPKIKHIVKLRDDKRQRLRDGLVLVEGWDELTLALRSGLMPQTILTAPELTSRLLEFSSEEMIQVSRPVFEKISHRENPDGWMGIFPTPQHPLSDLNLLQDPLVLIAEAVEKPGNLGAILRTADAAGVDAVFVCDPRVEIWNPNVIRASRGAVFVIPTVESSSAETLAWLREKKMQILAATPAASAIYTDVDLTGGLAIALGTEDKGLSDFWLKQADLRVKIPMRGSVNSLNVSISAALITYEAVRQRRHA